VSGATLAWQPSHLPTEMALLLTGPEVTQRGRVTAEGPMNKNELIDSLVEEYELTMTFAEMWSTASSNAYEAAGCEAGWTRSRPHVVSLVINLKRGTDDVSRTDRAGDDVYRPGWRYL
jgi:hypothetical protein